MSGVGNRGRLPGALLTHTFGNLRSSLRSRRMREASGTLFLQAPPRRPFGDCKCNRLDRGESSLLRANPADPLPHPADFLTCPPSTKATSTPSSSAPKHV